MTLLEELEAHLRTLGTLDLVFLEHEARRLNDQATLALVLRELQRRARA